MPNHLAQTDSPYLLQHADNPVDWYPWGEEALEIARRTDKPIFLSIGYAACHWCHVMAHESFEDAATAAILNDHFVCIKVDREQRPDLDSIYMAAVTALTGQGGWPMSVFLTPDLHPFFAGTYFPPTPRYGMPGFKELLLSLSEAWLGEREEIERVGAQAAAELQTRAVALSAAGTSFTDTLEGATRILIESYDGKYGGWGSAPKFPQPMTIEFLLRRSLAGKAGALKPALHALSAMARGGMYDVVGGGFARYSTDDSWHIPHFEKMLYDNAQLTRAYLHAWQMSGDAPFRRVVETTLGFVAREMLSPEGGFYSSLDADSDGQEGSYYAWTQAEIREALGDQAAFFERAYAVRPAGNWEGRTILQRALDDASLGQAFGMTPQQIVSALVDCHSRLLSARNRRIRPGTDDKTLTCWNGLMLAAFAEAGRGMGQAGYLEIARRNAEFLLNHLQTQGSLRRAWRKGRAGSEVFLEDYAALILGLLELYQADFDPRWFSEAERLADEMIRRFDDPAGGFFDTPADAEKLLLRPKDLQDNATPSGNALAAEALLKLAAFSERSDWHERAEKALGLVADPAARYPTAFGRWLSVIDFGTSRVKQVAVIGDPGDEQTRRFITHVQSAYRPNLVLAASSYPPGEGSPALLADRPPVAGAPTAYVCEGFVCLQPVTGLEEFRHQIP